MSHFLAHVAREAGAVPVELRELGEWTAVASGVTLPIAGIYRRLAEVTDLGAMVSSDGVAATLNVASDEIAGLARGDGIVIRGDSYRVVGVEPTGRGRTLLTLGI